MKNLHYVDTKLLDNYAFERMWRTSEVAIFFDGNSTVTHQRPSATLILTNLINKYCIY